MCIVFIYQGTHDPESDYSLIVISNRDENYDRPSQKMEPWSEDPNIYGGRDLQTGCEGGTWLAISIILKRIGLLLNLPGNTKKNAKSRGKIVENFVKFNSTTKEYVESIKDYSQECNQFVLVAIEFGIQPIVYTYDNSTNKFTMWPEKYLAFSNSLPDNPLTKVEAGKLKLQKICSRLNKLCKKEELIAELIELLKSEERQLPDKQLKEKQPNNYQELSSIFVNIPHRRYGTRAHSIILVTKTGHIDLIEISLQPLGNPLKPKWERTEFEL